MNAIHINWIALGRVAGLSTLIGVAIVAAFSIGVLGVSRMDSAQGDTARVRRSTGYMLAAGAHGLCILAILYGLYLLIPQFHH
jgi:hypothetical protein